MKTLIFGENGLLGLELSKMLKEASHEILAYNLSDVDIRSELVAKSIIMEDDFDLLIYAKGYEDIYAAEENEKIAREINALGAKNLAEICKDKGVPMIYISTPYVFDGNKTVPYTPEDEPNPLNAYGRSKLEGENVIRETLDNHYIIRTGKLFGVMKPNFVDDIVTKAKQGQSFKAFRDMRYTPTWTFTLAKTIERLIDTTKLKINYGIYHCTNSGSCSDYDFILEVISTLKLSNKINMLKLSEVRQKVKLPENCVLDSSKAPGIRIHWDDALHNYLKLKGYTD
jgi:dTDP-4-dehydrorhamnose reductase